MTNFEALVISEVFLSGDFENSLVEVYRNFFIGSQLCHSPLRRGYLGNPVHCCFPKQNQADILLLTYSQLSSVDLYPSAAVGDQGPV